MSAVTVLQPNGTKISHKTLTEKSPTLIELDTSQDSWTYPYPTDFKIHEHPLDDIRELKVAVIGAGLAGIIAGSLLPAKVPGIKLTILEKNADLVSQPNCYITAYAESVGRNLVRKCISGCQMRYSSPRLPSHVFPKSSMERRVRPRLRNPRLLAERGQKA
jgi:hypothetical protein